MKNNKKGFSLAEVMIVVAIMVILTGATAVGIVSWLNSAKSTAANLEQNNGDHFEESAINEIKKIAGTAGSHVVQQTKVNTPAVTQAPEVTEAPKTTDAPEVTEAPKTTEAPRTTDAPNPQGGNGGSGNSGSGNSGSSGSSGAISTSDGAYTYWDDHGGQLTVDIDQESIKNANTITLTFKVNSGSITGVNNLSNYSPSINCSGNTVTVVIKKSDCPEWMRNNWNSGNFGGTIYPQFALSGGTKTQVSLVSATVN